MIRVLIQEGSGNVPLAAVKPEWQELFATTGCSPFMAWEWMSVWFENFGEKRRPFILKAYRDDTLIAILPMCLEKRKVLGMSINQLSFIGDGIGGADHLDLIARPEDKSVAVSAIFDFLQREFNCDLVRLENLPIDSATVHFLQTAEKQGRGPFSSFSESKTAICPQIDLSEGWESVLNRSKRAENFKRRLKKLERSSNFHFRTLTSPDDARAAFERFLHLHEQRWQNAGGSEMTGHPRLIAFQRQIVKEMSLTGLIRFDELWIDGECRSSVYGLDDGMTFYYYNSGYDFEYSHLSVGLVLLGLSVKAAVERGNLLYDFLRGDENYKFDWANRTTQQLTVSLHNNTLPVLAHSFVEQGVAGILNFSKSILPASVAETLGSWRRAAKRNYQMSAR